MYKVVWKGAGEVNCTKDCGDLNAAMAWAKELNKTVVIEGNGMEIVGMFGVDSIKDGMRPDGTLYDWKKRRK